MSDVISLRAKESSAEEMLAQLRAAYPEAEDAIIIVFHPVGGMHMLANARRNDLAMASVRLGFLAGAGSE